MSFPGYIGKKCGMTQVFGEDGNAIPVTVVELLPLTVTQVKSSDKEGYTAVQVGYQEGKEKHVSRPEQGHLKKSNLSMFRKLKEFRVCADHATAFNVGDVIDPCAEGTFLANENQMVDITGQSIGKGFQGGTKRWGFSRGPMSHGSKSHRIPGSIGAGTTPGRVYKGKKMAGNMGNEQVTVKNLKVVKLVNQDDKKVLLVKGAVPGVEGGYLTIRAKREKWNA